MGGARTFWMRSAWLVATVTIILAGCDDGPTEPQKGPDIDMAAPTDVAPQLTQGLVCDSLRAPAGNRLVMGLYAEGDQVYRWSGTAWVFVEPAATLYVSRFLKWPVGTHYVGPTWEAYGGSKVTGAVAKRCSANANAIPWLLLTATPSTSYGIFKGVTSSSGWRRPVATRPAAQVIRSERLPGCRTRRSIFSTARNRWGMADDGWRMADDRHLSPVTCHPSPVISSPAPTTADTTSRIRRCWPGARRQTGSRGSRSRSARRRGDDRAGVTV